MDDRIKKALYDLDSATILNQLPILSNDLVNSKDSSTSSNSVSSNNDEDQTTSTTLLFTSYRPWSNTDYYNRVRTYTISNWFAKPSEIDPLQCSRFGWINVEADMLECETCKKRLYYKVPSSFSISLVNKRIKDFLISLQSTGHRDNCPWRDNGCPSFFSRLLDIPFQTQFEAFIKRSQNIYNNSSNINLPILSDDFHQQWINKQKQQKQQQNILNVLVKIAKLPLDDIKSKAACLLALCGWDFNLDSNIKDEDNEDTSIASKEKENKASLYCSYCQRVCGIWNFIENKSNITPFNENKEIVYNSTNSSIDNSSNSVGNKRKREEDIEEEKKIIQFEKVINQSFNHNINNKKQTNTNTSSLFSTFGSGFSSPFSNLKSTGWDWGESFSNSTTNFKEAIESKPNDKKEFSPIKEHRWFCPWMLVIDNSSNKNENIDNNNEDANTNTNSISGWENLLGLLLNQSTYDSKDFIDLKSDKKYHSIINSLNSSIHHHKIKK